MSEGRIALTIVIPTLNEAGQIGELVRSLDWASEVIVSDGGSSDETVPIAAHAGALVLESTGSTIAAQRNAAISVAVNEWVFALDADERVSASLRSELPRVLAAPEYQAYRVRRQNFYLGRELRRGHWGRDWVTRLFTRDQRYEERRVHEGLEKVVEPGRLEGCLTHIPYRDLSHQLEKMERYAKWGAMDLRERGKRASIWDLSTRPFGRFLRAYLLQGNAVDGRFGLTTSMLGAYGTFLKYAHLWALERETPDPRPASTSVRG
ncbi:MAG: glycosyltransferase family 2 protein [Gemmatimonadota bacterium]